MISDFGIFLEMIGFILLLLVLDRVPTGIGQGLVQTGTKKLPHMFHRIKRKIIPDKFINFGLLPGIGFIILGLFLQFSFAPEI